MIAILACLFVVLLLVGGVYVGVGASRLNRIADGEEGKLD